MGKKSKKGVTRAGANKHPGAGKSRTKSGRAKSDASSRASRDNISVDGNPDLTRLASESKAPTGPPPKDVVAVVNNLVAAQQLNAEAAAAAAAEKMAEVVASGMSNGASNKENKSAEPTMDSQTSPARETEDEITNIGNVVDDAPPHVGDVAVSEDKVEDQPATVEETLNVEENKTPEPSKEVAMVPIVETAKPEVVSPVVEPPTSEVPEPKELAVAEPALVVEPPPLNVTSAVEAVEASKPAVPQPESREEPATAPKAEKVEDPAAPTVDTPKVEEKVAAAEPEKAKVAEVPIPPTTEASTKEAAPDVWSQKLRDVVVKEPTKPVLAVTPPPKSTSRSAVPLDMPNAQEVEVQQTDCGCLIL